MSKIKILMGGAIVLISASAIAQRDSGWFTTNTMLIVPGRTFPAVAGSPMRNALEHPAVHQAPAIRAPRRAVA